MPTRALALEHAQPTIASAAMPEAVRSFSALKLEDAGVGKPRPSSDCWREPVRPARLPPYEAPFKSRVGPPLEWHGVAKIAGQQQTVSLLPPFERR